MKIIENLWQVGGAEFTTVEDAAVYLVRFGQKAVLIDAGCGGAHKELTDNIATALPDGVEIQYLFLTHCHYDHTGGAAALKDHYGCRIVAHELDAVYLEGGDSVVTAADWYGAQLNPLKIDHVIKGTMEAFQFGSDKLTAYHCPGHSPGSVVYLTDMGATRVLFGQDVHGPLDASFLSDRGDYLGTLKFIMGLNADILCEGHFGIYRGKENVKCFIESYL